MNIQINGEHFYLDVDKYNKERSFMEYREKLLDIVGFSADESTVIAANKWLYDNNTQYRDFINV